MDPYAINEPACRGRQRRLLDAVSVMGVDLVVLTCRESVQWLTGAVVRPPFEPAATITVGGHVTLVLPERQLNDPAAVDERIGYAGQAPFDDGRRPTSSQLGSAAGRISERSQVRRRRIRDVQPPPVVPHGRPRRHVARRRADDLSVAASQRCRRAGDAPPGQRRQSGDVRAGPRDRPAGRQRARRVCRAARRGRADAGRGAHVFRSGLSLRCKGGLPRDRAAQAGELYILDLGVGFRGYYSDNARTIAVGGQPSAAQQRAWHAVMAVFPIIEPTVRPGQVAASCLRRSSDNSTQCRPWQFNHHLGHGVGLAAHEGPHLNPNWDDTFADGDFFTVEPGLYHDELRYGIRLEQNYLVTATGVELLTPWPLELV